MDNTLINYILPDANKNIDNVLKDLDIMFEENRNTGSPIFNEIRNTLSLVFGANNNAANHDMWIDYCDKVLEEKGVDNIDTLTDKDKDKVYNGFIDYVQKRIEEVADKVFGKKIDITITETLSKTVSVRAKDDEEAYKQVKDMYYNEEIVLDSSNYLTTDIDIEEKRVEKDIKYFLEVDFNTLEKGKEALVLVPDASTCSWIRTDKVTDFSVVDGSILIKTDSDTYTNDVGVIISANDRYGIGVVKNVTDGNDLYIVRNNITENQISKATRQEAEQYVFERITHTVANNINIEPKIELLETFESKDMYGSEDLENMLKIAKGNDMVLAIIDEKVSGSDKQAMLAIINCDFVDAELFNNFDSDICEQFICVMEEYNNNALEQNWKNTYKSAKNKMI